MFSTLYEKKVDFSPIWSKKRHSTLEMDTFKCILLLSYLVSLDLAHAFKSPFLDIEMTIFKRLALI